jgi:hypothetical protein
MDRFDVVLGLDEAGLGPLLGPLTLGYAAFRLPVPLGPDALLRLDLWESLGVGRDPGERRERPVVCDSKRLHSPGRLKPLEEEVLAWASLMGVDTGDFGAFLAAICPLARERPDSYDWYAAPPARFPLEADAARMRLRIQPVRRAMDSHGVALLSAGVAPLLEGEFNRLVQGGGSKARAELEGLARIIGHFWREHLRIAVLCDRQGGRTRYGGSLRREFPESEVRVLHESDRVSTYELTVPGVQGRPTLFVAFLEKGETDHLPIALASMFAKYLRELMMHQFNAWWGTHDPDLKPTAGYYKDGRRWLEDTRRLREALGVDESRLVRVK